MGVKKRSFLTKLGTLLVGLGLFLLFLVYWPLIYQLVNYRRSDSSKPDPNVSEPLGSLADENEEVLPINFDFGLVIPKLKITARVFPNVDSQDKGAYLPVLKKGIGHAKGSSLPGEPGPVFLFAHSSDNFLNTGRYNAIFLLLNSLSSGDEIKVYYQGDLYRYSVVEKAVVWPGEVDRNVRDRSGNFVVLQTCWPPGTALKRLLVFGVPDSS